MIPLYSRTLPDLLEERAETSGRHPAVVHRDGSTTYSELHSRAQRVGTALRSAGVGPGERVGLLATNRIEWLECYFGATATGSTVHAFNTWVTSRELEHLLGEAECSVLFLLAEHGRRGYLADLAGLVPELWEADPGQWTSRRFPWLRAVVVIDGAAPQGAVDYETWLAEAGEPAPLASPHVLTSAAGAAVVLYTSGSTARPKAVPLLHYGMIENGFHIGERMGLTEQDRVWLSSPLFWSFGCANALMATFTHGATLVLQEQFNPAAAVELIEAEQCTAAYLLPTLTRAILGEKDLDVQRLASLRTGVTIGGPEDIRLVVEELGIGEICNVYGATETYGNCCVTPHDMPLADRLTSQGPPLPGNHVRIMGESGVLPPGEIGEIQVKGHLTPGYLGAAPDTSIFTDDGYYRSGDLGSLCENGWLHYATRGTDMIKTAGINVAPAEVEEFLLSVDGVEQVAVVGAPDAAKGEIVVAYVVPREGVTLDEQALTGACRQAMASYKVPARMHLVSELPKTGTGKLHRQKLREQAAGAAPTLD